MPTLRQAVNDTIRYCQIFQYQPTRGEVYRFLLGRRCSWEELAPLLESFPKEKKKDRLLEEKLAGARRHARWAGSFPGVKAVFLTGSLAGGSARPGSDADFLVVTRRGWLQFVYWELTIAFSILGWRLSRFSWRKRIGTPACFNVFLAEDSLAMPPRKQNLFIANEIARAKPLVDKGTYYRDFLLANRWIEKFLPNAFALAGGVSSEEDVSSLSLTGTDQLFLHKRDWTEDVLRRWG